MKADMKRKLLEETKTMTVLFVYLALLLGAFTLYRRIILAEYAIPYLHYGYSLLEALILAKLIAVGRILHIGERFQNGPLIVPALYKAVSFGVFVLAFSILEHALPAFLEGKHPLEILLLIWSDKKYEITAKVLVIFAAFIPLFSIWEIGIRSHKENLFELLFREDPRRNRGF